MSPPSQTRRLGLPRCTSPAPEKEHATHTVLGPAGCCHRSVRNLAAILVLVRGRPVAASPCLRVWPSLHTLLVCLCASDSIRPLGLAAARFPRMVLLPAALRSCAAATKGTIMAAAEAAQPSNEQTPAEAFKAQGNAHFQAGEFLKAAAVYTQVVDQLSL